jgi:hypothetical protein
MVTVSQWWTRRSKMVVVGVASVLKMCGHRL